MVIKEKLKVKLAGNPGRNSTNGERSKLPKFVKLKPLKREAVSVVSLLRKQPSVLIEFSFEIVNRKKTYNTRV